jgi:hypothetical protein
MPSDSSEAAERDAKTEQTKATTSQQTWPKRLLLFLKPHQSIMAEFLLNLSPRRSFCKRYILLV